MSEGLLNGRRSKALPEKSKKKRSCLACCVWYKENDGIAIFNASDQGDFMEIMEIQGLSGTSRILVGETLASLSGYLPDTKVVVITDENIQRLHGEAFRQYPTITIGQGEPHKTLDTLAHIYAELIRLGVDRSSFIVAIGGGIVSDITGFAAATYMRGVPYGFVATTLLAQVDASVGGKNGVNFGGYKNMVGVFRQPRFVICDPHLLVTLPKQEVLCGLAEVIKHGAIADRALFTYLQANVQAVLALEPAVIEHLVHQSVVIKAGVVNADETEQGQRRILNFGHTIGHAVEKLSGIPHGQAVSIGMQVAARLSTKLAGLPTEQAGALQQLCKDFGLPTRLETPRTEVADALRKDKKKSGSEIHFVLIEKIGRAKVVDLDLEEVDRLLAELDTGE
jgi:3-dehydroquinate synthase